MVEFGRDADVSAALALEKWIKAKNNEAIVARCLALVAELVELYDSVTSAAFKMG